MKVRGTRYRSWLRHYATSRKVSCSIPDVIGFFNWPKPSSRTMTLVSTQLLTEMSTRNLPGGKGRLARGADNPTSICELIVQKMWEPRRLTTLWASTACYSYNLTFFYHINVWGSWSIAPRILNFDLSWRWVVSFTPRPLYSEGKNAQYPRGKSVSLRALSEVLARPAP
jgi:hypothetical protein